DLIVPHVLNPIEDTRRFVDILSYYSITLADIKLLCTTASAVTATTTANLKRINSAIARLHGITSHHLEVIATPTPVPSTSARTPSPEYLERLERSPRRSPQYHRVPVRLEEHQRQLSPRPGSRQSCRNINVSCRPDLLEVVSKCPIAAVRRRPVLLRVASTCRNIAVSRLPDLLEVVSTCPITAVSRRPVLLSRQYAPEHRRHPSPSSSGSRRSVLAHRRQPSPSPSGIRQSVPVDRFHIRCCFCHQSHHSADCNVATELSDRALRAVNEGRCLICLYLHAPGFCRRDAKCRFCGAKNHHPAVCLRSLYVERDFDMDYSASFKDMYDLYVDYYRRNTRD
ncbi:hypothetical protein V3C99_006293, partial [Haemonchus contortus]